jgi:hypothetical protein
VGEACGTYRRGEKIVQGFDGKVRRKKTTWKTEAQMENGIIMNLPEIG